MARRKLTLTDIIILCILLAVSFTCFLPVVHVIAVSFSDKAAAAAGLVTLFPVGFTAFPYKYLLDDQQFFRSLLVSVERVLLGGGINLLLTILMAYALSKEKKEFPGRNVYMWIIVFTMLFNGGLIPWFMVVKTVGLLDTIWALVLPGAVPVFNVILLMNFFRGIPKEIKEAAVVDGAGPWRTMIQMFVPLALPAIATVTLFSVVGHWNAFFDGLILINKQENVPLQTYIQQLVVRPADFSSMRAEDIANLSQRTFNAAKIVVTMLPILLIYPFLQRYFVQGITLGSVKE
ncbi:carbohydrate ABC transporter permease [Paenibacillus alkalitolerans]|uniref:carbohydrate ABC transporter permease n=1 Tax=Paenibacillus alkalitolerans TaxID=2799335 RepID=UPI0018F39D00|nr:carbohydrate ABC transporter permease [Paenibacillus alkalitolerans]